MSFAILCSGVALGVYLPGLLLRRDLRRLGIPAEVFVLESLFPEERRRGLRRTRSAFHRDFRAAVAGHKLARDPTPLLDEVASTALLQRWADEDRRRFVVLSGFWLPLLDRFRSLARGVLDVELCHVDSVDSPSFRATAAFSGIGHNRRLLDAEAGCVRSAILATREAPVPFSRRERPIAHGGGWGMGTYAKRAEELAQRGWPMDVIGCELEDAGTRAAGSRHFLADPEWEPWRGEPGFPPFGEVAPDGTASYRVPDDHHAAFDLVRAAPFVLSKPGGATLLDSLAAATPVVLLEPLGDHERRNAELWERLGFGIAWERFLALDDPRADLEWRHLALCVAREQVPDYAALLAAERQA